MQAGLEGRANQKKPPKRIKNGTSMAGERVMSSESIQVYELPAEAEAINRGPQHTNHRNLTPQ